MNYAENELRMVYSATAEREVVGLCLIQPDILDVVSEGLTPDHFGQPRSRTMFEAMLTMRGKGQPIDPVSMEHYLRGVDKLGLVGGLEGIGKFCDVVTSTWMVKRHMHTMRVLYRRRKIVEAARLIVEAGTGPVEDEDAFVQMAEASVFKATESDKPRGTARWVRDLVTGWWERLVARAKRKTKLVGIPSRINALDDMLGGFQPGKLYVIAGRPSHGKSALGVRLACEASMKPSVRFPCHRENRTLEEPVRDASGNVAMLMDGGQPTGVPDRRVWPSLVISLEMDADELLTRMAAAEAELDSRKVLQGKMMQDDLQRLTDAAGRIHEALIMIEDASGRTVEDMMSLARRWYRESVDQDRAKDDPGGLIVIDYLQLAKESQKFDKGGRSREQAIAHISKSCKELAKELGVPVLLLCQLNRGVDNRSDHRPQVSDLRESGAIEQDADVIMFTYREAQYHPDESDAWYTEEGGYFTVAVDRGGPPESVQINRAEYGEIVVGKQRGGPTGVVPVVWKGPRTRYYGADHIQTTR